jgi:hypothetical protein
VNPYQYTANRHKHVDGIFHIFCYKLTNKIHEIKQQDYILVLSEKFLNLCYLMFAYVKKRTLSSAGNLFFL